jgi:hypothetical protein
MFNRSVVFYNTNMLSFPQQIGNPHSKAVDMGAC